MPYVEGLALCPICSYPVERPLRPVHGVRPHRAKCDVCIARLKFLRLNAKANEALDYCSELIAKREESERRFRRARELAEK
jgi:hypothetical protein